MPLCNLGVFKAVAWNTWLLSPAAKALIVLDFIVVASPVVPISAAAKIMYFPVQFDNIVGTFIA